MERWGDFPASHSLVDLSFRSASRSSFLFFEIEIEIDKEREIEQYHLVLQSVGIRELPKVSRYMVHFFGRERKTCTRIF